MKVVSHKDEEVLVNTLKLNSPFDKMLDELATCDGYAEFCRYSLNRDELSVRAEVKALYELKNNKGVNLIISSYDRSGPEGNFVLGDKTGIIEAASLAGYCSDNVDIRRWSDTISRVFDPVRRRLNEDFVDINLVIRVFTCRGKIPEDSLLNIRNELLSGRNLEKGTLTIDICSGKESVDPDKCELIYVVKDGCFIINKDDDLTAKICRLIDDKKKQHHKHKDKCDLLIIYIQVDVFPKAFFTLNQDRIQNKLLASDKIIVVVSAMTTDFQLKRIFGKDESFLKQLRFNNKYIKEMDYSVVVEEGLMSLVKDLASFDIIGRNTNSNTTLLTLRVPESKVSRIARLISKAPLKSMAVCFPAGHYCFGPMYYVFKDNVFLVNSWDNKQCEEIEKYGNERGLKFKIPRSVLL